jgi:hypothetical protein
MKIEQASTLEPKLQDAVDELASMIAARYPSAAFRVSHHPDGAGTVLLDAIVDMDDTEPVNDLILERMEQLRLDEGVPILVIPLRTPERIARLREAMQAAWQSTVPAALP